MPLAVALALALAAGGPRIEPLAELRAAALGSRAASPDLRLRLVAGRLAPAVAPLDGAGARADAGLPVCSGDFCQPIVAVPGFEPSYGRAHRSEAVVALLTRARVEPLATMAWALVSTGFRLDWTPAAMEGPNSGGRGWGSVTLRLRLRIDAHHRFVIPPRPR